MEEHDEPIAAAFAAKLKALRTAGGLTMAQLAAKVKPPMLGPAIARYEAGERLPSWGAVVRLAKALACTPNDFLPTPPKSARRKPA